MFRDRKVKRRKSVLSRKRGAPGEKQGGGWAKSIGSRDGNRKATGVGFKEALVRLHRFSFRKRANGKDLILKKGVWGSLGTEKNSTSGRGVFRGTYGTVRQPRSGETRIYDKGGQYC